MNFEDIKFLLLQNEIEGALNLLMKSTESVVWTTQRRLAELHLAHFRRIQKDTSKGILIKTTAEFDQIISDCLVLLERCEEKQLAFSEFQIAFDDHLLLNNSLPFAGRKEFRKLFKKALETEKAQMIFVNTNGQPGLSYLERYLEHLNKNEFIFQLIRFQVRILNEIHDPAESKLAKLIKELSSQLNINLDKEDNDQVKITPFFTKLRENLSNKDRDKPVVFFLHDFEHIKPTLPDDLNHFIRGIINFIINNKRCIFIIAGFNNEKLLDNWSQLEDLRDFYPNHKLETITQDNFKECLLYIYQKYPKQIEKRNGEPVEESDYIDGMLDQLIDPDISPQFDIKKAAKAISRHLDILKDISI